MTPERDSAPPAKSDDPVPPGAIPPAKNNAAVPALTPEEQMEAFAQKLKEEDWGHQPC